ncbi:hypothetical protein M422DRAFT_258018 [Sphaerobolus stellatus SS14]|uniref:Uncharacterized protein n=1 Tax=Sphaerobolus stellatus (strain SS14) TaxID=990650 RepID=A0A0C9UW85_SPHS4|nr:hypothetical protein M422DRAFT_258018 [Sphaerobolus stellatus SS14]
MSYKCLSCNKGYDTPKGLSNHASSCQAKQMEEMRVVEFRKGQPSHGFHRKRAKTLEETFVHCVRRVEGPAKEDGALTDAGKIAGSLMSSISLGLHSGNLESPWESPCNPNNKISGDNDFVQPNPDPCIADSLLGADENILDNNNALHTHLDVQPSISQSPSCLPNFICPRNHTDTASKTQDEDGVELVEVDDSEEFVMPESSQAQPQVPISLLSGYYYGSRSGECSAADFNELCRVVCDAHFDPSEVQGFIAAKRDACVDRYSQLEDGGIIPGVGRGWEHNVEVPISIPEGHVNWTNKNGQIYNIPGLHHKSIMQIVQTWFENQVNFHYTPFELWWKPKNDVPAVRLYADISSSDAFKHTYMEVNFDSEFQVPGCTPEKVVAAIQIASDATLLAQFGKASLWPIYTGGRPTFSRMENDLENVWIW